jgi:hypothetical protein
MLAWWRGAVLGVMVALLPSVALAQAALADGFKKVPSGAKVVLTPMDVELFSISAGGILEPQAEWTSRALDHLKSAYQAKKDALGVEMLQLDDDGDEVVEDFNRLHGAVGNSIALHHYIRPWRLPSKDGQFDWTLGDGVDAIRAKTGANYALFTFVRDSYASSERVVTMVIGALFGFGLQGGTQIGYASLVDLRDGRVVWFNLLRRARGDLRTPDKARETLENLLEDFPG